jgi:hypothetical protein
MYSQDVSSALVYSVLLDSSVKSTQPVSRSCIYHRSPRVPCVTGAPEVLNHDEVIFPRMLRRMVAVADALLGMVKIELLRLNIPHPSSLLPLPQPTRLQIAAVKSSI